MMKRILALLLLLACLPLSVTAELEYIRQEKRFIDFPAMDEWRGNFSSVKKWTIVTPESLDENWDLVAARGDTEEEIRQRFAGEHFLFEAYSPDLPQDACFRAEVYENDLTREVWHLRHLGSEERKELNDLLLSGLVLPDREVYILTNKGSNESACIMGYFTNLPGGTHESGQIQLRFRNGRMYVFSYCVSGRMAGRSRWYSSKEKAAFSKTPMDLSADSSFRNKMLPRLPDFALTAPVPEQTEPGNITVQGTVEKGSALTAALDGNPIEGKADKAGKFNVTVPLTEVGEHTLTLTVTNSKYTERVMTYPIIVSDTVTPLNITGQPVGYAYVGDVTLKGLTSPGAQLTFTLDEGEPQTFTAAADGSFTHTFHLADKGEHSAVLTARKDGLEPASTEMAFVGQYEDINDGIRAFSVGLTEHRIDKMAEDIDAYVGEKVKISVRIKEVTLNEQGLGLLCEYNPPAGMKHDETPLYLSVPGYAQCQLHENMIITIYGTVVGQREEESEDAGIPGAKPETRMEILMEYGTYMVYK